MAGEGTAPRLSRTTLPGLAPGDRGHDDVVRGPAIDPDATTTGIVHLGLGAFHRSHQAVMTEDAAALSGEDRWGVLGVTQRSRRVVRELRPQDCLYGVLTTGRTTTSLRVVGSIRGAVFLGDDTGTVLRTIAAPTTAVVTSTVTEKGYRRAPGGGPDLADDGVAADVAFLRTELAHGARPATAVAAARTPVGALVRGLARRWHADAGPLSVLCCDNMPDNGQVLADLVHGVVAAAGGPHADALREWIERSVRFPSTMVDRITPATTPAHHAEAERLLGLRDEALVVAEPFTQWVIEDSFAGPRPRWELAGATLTGDVRPWEATKLRVLNGSHSAAAYLGALRGHGTIAEAVADPDIAAHVRALIADDVLPTLAPLAWPDGQPDLARYGEEVLERFANPATGHTTSQVASDGSQKLPIRLFGTIADRLAAGVVPHAATATVAAWVVFVARGHDALGAPLGLDDPLADVLRAAAAGSESGLADRMLALEQIFPEALREHDAFRSALRTEVAALLTGVPA